MLLWDVWIGMWNFLTTVKILWNIFYLLSMAPPNFWQLFCPTLEIKSPFCFFFPHSPGRHYEIVSGAVFQMRDILLSEQQGGTQLILTWRTHGIWELKNMFTAGTPVSAQLHLGFMTSQFPNFTIAFWNKLPLFPLTQRGEVVHLRNGIHLCCLHKTGMLLGSCL